MSLSEYLPVLLEELSNAKARVPDRPPMLYDNYGPDLSHLAELDRSPYRTLSEWFGVPREAFPPVDRLSDTDVQQVVDAILDLWEAFRFFPVLPKDLPIRPTYTALVGAWDHEMQYISAGTHYIEFCSYEPKECPFPSSFCMCKDFTDPGSRPDSDH